MSRGLYFGFVIFVVPFCLYFVLFCFVLVVFCCFFLAPDTKFVVHVSTMSVKLDLQYIIYCIFFSLALYIPSCKIMLETKRERERERERCSQKGD